MFRKFGLSALVLGTALTVLGPGSAQAREPEREHHRHRFSVFFGVGPRRHYVEGYYDRRGYWTAVATTIAEAFGGHRNNGR